MTTKMVGAQLTGHAAAYFEKRLAETHKSQSDLLRQIITAYEQFESAGYLSPDGDKMLKLETELQLKEKIRQVEAGRLRDKIAAEKELAAIKEQKAKQRARDRANRNAPKVDWGNVAIGGSGDNFMLGDE
jgi:hypothetical protein